MKTITILLLLTGHVAWGQQVRRISAADLRRELSRTDSALVINLWATWCAPCVREMPWFEQQAQRLKNKPVKFIFLSLDMEDAYPTAIRRFLTRRNIRSTVWWLNEPNANKYASLLDPRWEGSIPATLFLHPKKNFRRFVEGEISEKELQQITTIFSD